MTKTFASYAEFTAAIRSANRVAISNLEPDRCFNYRVGVGIRLEPVGVASSDELDRGVLTIDADGYVTDAVWYSNPPTHTPELSDHVVLRTEELGIEVKHEWQFDDIDGVWESWWSYDHDGESYGNGSMTCMEEDLDDLKDGGRYRDMEARDDARLEALVYGDASGNYD